MKLKNKILLIFFLLLMFILFLNTSNVFASFDFTYKEVNYSYPDLPVSYNKVNFDHYVIGYISSSDIRLYCCDAEISFTSDNLIRTSVSDHYLFWFKLDISSNTWVYNKAASSIQGFATGPANVIYSTHDLYQGGTKVFQIPVTEVPEVQVPGVQIPALETAEEIPQAMGQTLKIVIPVGLIVLGIGLVIYLIKRVIYLSQ